MTRRTQLMTLVLAALVGAWALSACAAPAATLANEQEPTHTIGVTGNGVAYGTPDIAVAHIGVQSRDADPTRAVSDNNTKMNALMAALRELGIENKDIQTANFSIYAQQDFEPQTGRPTEAFTYVVDNTLMITVRDLTKVGDVLGQVVEAGANSIHGVSFSISDKAALEAEAREQAMADAKARAEQLARAAGVTLDRPLTITEFASGPTPFDASVQVVREMAVGGGAPVPVSTGQIQVALQVNVTYTIK